MKSRLNITIDNDLAEQAKRYALLHNTSVSNLVENFFKSLKRPGKKKSVIDLMDELPKPAAKMPTGDMKSDYFKSRSKKYGF